LAIVLKFVRFATKLTTLFRLLPASIHADLPTKVLAWIG